MPISYQLGSADQYYIFGEKFAVNVAFGSRFGELLLLLWRFYVERSRMFFHFGICFARVLAIVLAFLAAGFHWANSLRVGCRLTHISYPKSYPALSDRPL